MPSEDELIPIGEAAEILGVVIQTLRRWDANGKLVARKTAGGQRRYLRSDLERFAASDIYRIAHLWATGAVPTELPDEVYCPTRAVFESRLQRFSQLLETSGAAGGNFSLVVAAVGEIGNNSFDHNIGSWPDAMGVFFGYDIRRGEVVLADRGQGVLATLRRVRPELSTPAEALKMAFTEVITGRAPEKRGNGLKFVRKVVGRGASGLAFQTGDAKLSMSSGATGFDIGPTRPPVRGTLAVLKFGAITE